MRGSLRSPWFHISLRDGHTQTKTTDCLDASRPVVALMCEAETPQDSLESLLRGSALLALKHTELLLLLLLCNFPLSQSSELAGVCVCALAGKTLRWGVGTHWMRCMWERELPKTLFRTAALEMDSRWSEAMGGLHTQSCTLPYGISGTEINGRQTWRENVHRATCFKETDATRRRRCFFRRSRSIIGSIMSVRVLVSQRWTPRGSNVELTVACSSCPQQMNPRVLGLSVMSGCSILPEMIWLSRSS